MARVLPMLAGTLPTLVDIRFPILASPKLDGIRCVVQGRKALSRSLKVLPNTAARSFLEGFPALEGLDGELMVHGQPLHAIESVFMARNSTLPPQWYFGVFDALPQKAGEPFTARSARVAAAVASISAGTHVVAVPQVEVRSLEEFLLFEKRVLGMGFEGVVLRRPASQYKHGRSTIAEGALLKWKRFEDSEAEIIGFEASSAGGTLGAFLVRDLLTKKTFKVGTGITQAQRKELWEKRRKLRGRILKYKHFPSNRSQKPPSSVYLGLRSLDDMTR